jgi:GAF domain-containing protein
MVKQSLPSKKLNNLSNKLRNIDLKKLTMDQKFSDWLNELGNFSSTDRVYIYFFEKDENEYIIASNTHEWCKKNIPSVKEEQQNVPIDLFPYYKQVLYERKEVAQINSVNDLPTDAQSMLELMNFQGVKSILAVPILKKSNPIGFIGYETVKKENNWKDEDLKALQLVAKLIAENYK